MNNQDLTHYGNLLKDVESVAENYRDNAESLTIAAVQNDRDQFSALKNQIGLAMPALLKAKNDTARAYTKTLRSAYLRIEAELRAEKPKVTNIDDKARYKAELEALPAQELKDKAAENYESANVLVRYTMSEMLQSIASRIKIALEFPESGDKPAGRPTSSAEDSFEKYFGNLESAHINLETLQDDEYGEGMEDPGIH